MVDKEVTKMGKSRERKRQKARQRSVQSAYERRTSRNETEVYLDPETGVVMARNLPGIPRMSDIISHLSQPVLIRIARFSQGPEVLEQSIRLTIFAWNATFMWSWTRWFSMMIESYCLLPDDTATAHRMLQDIYQIVSEGQRRHYPDVKRRIIDVRFNDYSHDELHFDVLHRSIDGSDDRMLESIV